MRTLLLRTYLIFVVIVVVVLAAAIAYWRRRPGRRCYRCDTWIDHERGATNRAFLCARCRTILQHERMWR